MRIGGLASGMDTDQIIRDLMRVQRMPMDKLTQQKQQLEWQRDAYRELNTLMTKFRDNIFDTVMRSANMNAKTVTSSNSAFVTASATAAASNGSFVITKVDQLATAATNKSQGSLSKSTIQKLDPTKDLYSQKELLNGDFNWKQGTVEKENVSFSSPKSTLELAKKNFVNKSDLETAMAVKVNGQSFNIVTELPAGQQLKENEVLFNLTTGVLDFGKELAAGTRVNVTYVTESSNHYFTSSIETFNAKGQSVKETFAFQGTRSLNQVISEVNASSAGVSMFYDSQTDRVAVQRKETGNFNQNKGSEADINAANLALTDAIDDAEAAKTVWLAAKSDFEDAEDNFVNHTNYIEAFEDSLKNRYDEVYQFEYNKAIDEDNLDSEAAAIVAMDAVKAIADDLALEEARNAGSDAMFGTDELLELNLTREVMDQALIDKNEADSEVIVKSSALTAISGREMNFQGSFFTNVLQLDTFKEVGGTNAVFTINGLETERQSNNFSINGVTITLKDTFDNPPVTLGIATNTDKVFDTITGFVNEYNEMLEKINGKLTEERYRDYKPLTEEQKESMSEKDIERWEERAMSGLLRRDPMLSGGLDRLRMEIYSPVSGLSNNSVIRQLTDLGITTSKDYMQRGKLEIDEAKLREAIERDPEGVFQLFAADGATNADKGIARRMRDSLQETMRAVSERAGGSFGKLQNHQFTLGRNLNDIETRVSNFERRLKQVEDRYWKQFTAMEKAMQQANSQMESMYSMLFGNQG